MIVFLFTDLTQEVLYDSLFGHLRTDRKSLFELSLDAPNFLLIFGGTEPLDAY